MQFPVRPRGNGFEIAEQLRQGEVELAIAGPLDEWARFDVWPLFTESFALVVNARHRLAAQGDTELGEIAQERLLTRAYCEQAAQFGALLRSRGVNPAHSHELSSERDLLPLLEADVGVAVVPRSVLLPGNLTRIPIKEFPLARTVYLYTVAGRPRGGPVTTLLKQLNAGRLVVFRELTFIRKGVRAFSATSSLTPTGARVEVRRGPSVCDSRDR